MVGKGSRAEPSGAKGRRNRGGTLEVRCKGDRALAIGTW